MERIRALINKLQQQLEQGADAATMMVTVQIIQAELAQLSSSVPYQRSTTKVAVVLPSVNQIPYSSKEISEPETKTNPIPEVSATSEVTLTEVPKINDKNSDQQPKKKDQSGWLFDPVHEIPTLAHQNEFKEMNDVLAQNSSSLNDKLKTDRTELGAVLTEAPVRDLKKAIGVNDRFVFLSELFRGDEAMYERSIKTINNFRIYPEAEYWIERELKVKLGWDESKAAVKHFCQLVKRRFS